MGSAGLMKQQLPNNNPKATLSYVKLLTLICLVLVFVLFAVLRSDFSVSSKSQSTISPTSSESTTTSAILLSAPPAVVPDCDPQLTITKAADIAMDHESYNNKLPLPVMQALLHYATSNITPQQTLKEVSVTAEILQQKGPSNFLVFGLGHDSLMWTTLNYGGRTVFLEEDRNWINTVSKNFPGFFEIYHVEYNTKVRNADELLIYGLKEAECTAVKDPRSSECMLSLKELPEEIYEVEWDSIMVDAPTGYHDDAPGRMTAIYTAGLLARKKKKQKIRGVTDVFVHDVDRAVEDKYSKAFLCEWYMKHEEGRLRHFTIPTQNSNLGSFCP